MPAGSFWRCRVLEQGVPPNPEFSELGQYEIDGRSVRRLKYEYCLRNEVVVLGRIDANSKGPVVVGMLNPARRSLVAEVEAVLCRPVRAVRLNSWEIRHALAEGYGTGEEERDRAELVLGPVRDFSFE